MNWIDLNIPLVSPLVQYPPMPNVNVLIPLFYEELGISTDTLERLSGLVRRNIRSIQEAQQETQHTLGRSEFQLDYLDEEQMRVFQRCLWKRLNPGLTDDVIFYRRTQQELNMWLAERAEILEWRAECQRLDSLKDAFQDRDLEKPGVLVELRRKDGTIEQVLIGHWLDPGFWDEYKDAVVVRYAVVWEGAS